MKLLTSELKQFKANASFIKQNNILPILEYLKIEKGKITKSSLNSFCTQQITYKGEPFLIEESVLMNAIDAAGPEIDIQIKGLSITLSSNGMKWKCQSQNIAEFPKSPDRGDNPILMTGDIINQISIVANFVDEENVQQAATMVYIDSDIIAASNGFIGYGYKMKTGIDKIFIPKSTCNAIRHFESLEFIETEKYQFFLANGIEYGFIKPEAKFIDISSFFTFEAESKFEVNKSEIISFNTQAIKTAVSKVSTTVMDILPGSMSLSMSDTGYEREVSKIIDIVGGTDLTFKYNPELMNRLLKSLPGDIVTVHQTDGRLYVTSEENQVLLILKIS